jgi:23S rRNA (guanosine2251-2'-O)-methyltransferase
MGQIVGIHPVREALRAQRPLARIHVSKGSGGNRLQEIIDLARELKVAVRFEEKATLDRMASGTPHQGVVALTAAQATVALEEVLPDARLLILLDGVEDPHNLGAIVRTANAVGAAAVLTPERRSAPVTDTVERAAAGALAYTPVVKVGNLNQTVEKLKQAGFWIYGLDERGETTYDQCNYAVPTVLILGAEGSGLHQLTAKHCDALVRIPMSGQISSLNVSVAAGVVLFDWKRRFGKV